MISNDKRINMLNNFNKSKLQGRICLNKLNLSSLKLNKFDTKTKNKALR